MRMFTLEDGVAYFVGGIYTNGGSNYKIYRFNPDGSGWEQQTSWTLPTSLSSNLRMPSVIPYRD